MTNLSETEILALCEGEALRLCEKTTIIETIISLTKHNSARVRQRALKEMCPCRVKEDLSDFWNRVMEMIDDESATVRYQVMHTLCDGSPSHMEDNVADALDIFNNDADKKIRRKAHQVLTTYRRTGKWNVM
ncbi:uncharacterized protein LOC132731896 [Ruditapes philippinarum]|uniref:uncharacterized protein LOC132731896 n=1 Tax=Ruditapes philippinarum TaxID=129788 RepID=UPI00295AE128|nr:uncharacterized protein LOC132731896 [Ruditapes philippinarum]XP_060574178.1 uncharacterized protein LOC132731896 [Ruditapes philippinarum]